MVSPASVSGIQGQTGQQNPYGNAMQDLNMDQFLKMMIAELQNQDPLDPMDNVQILQQIGQIREITSNDTLTSTLEAAFLGQNLATANNLMGRWVVAMSEENGEVIAAGQVTQVSIVNGIPKLHVDGETRALDLKDISQIQSEDDAEALTNAMPYLNRRIQGTTEPTPLQPISQNIVGQVVGVSLSTDGRPMLHVETTDGATQFTVAAENAKLATIGEVTLAAANAMIGKVVRGTSEPSGLHPFGEDVVGEVTLVSLPDGRPLLHVKDAASDDAADPKTIYADLVTVIDEVSP